MASRCHEVKVSVLDQMLIQHLPGATKIRALLIQRAGSLSAWAGSNGFWPARLSHHLRRSEDHPAISEAIGRDLGIPVEEVISALNDGREAPATQD